jgi:Na+/H+-dicarboxylate symporter
VLAALVAGFAIGVIATATSSSWLLSLTTMARPVGTLWVNAVLMTVIPLVVSSLIVSVTAAAESGLVRAVGLRSVLLLALLLFSGAALSALVAPALVAWLPVDAAAADALRATVGAATPTSPPATLGVAQWVASLAPPNVVKAAADGALLPLVVFTIAFALALTRIDASHARHVLDFLDAVMRATGVLLSWIISAAPIGVFALALSLGTQSGAAVAGALARYIALTVALCLVATAGVYVIALAGGRVSAARFARAVAPAQVVAASSRSSLAALPAMLRAAEGPLALPAVAGGVFLPFTVATFKFTSPLAYLAATCFMARLFGVELGTARLLALAPLAVALSMGVPGVPGGWLTAAPIFAAAGLPVEVVGVLLAVDTIPDVFRTVGNVTADLAAATVVGHYARRADSVAVRTPSRGVEQFEFKSGTNDVAGTGG